MALPSIVPTEAFAADPARSDQLSHPFAGDDLVLLEVRAGDAKLADAMGAYSSRAGLYLPVGELGRLMDLAIVVEPPERRAAGWVISPDRQFILDLASGQAVSGMTRIGLANGDAVLLDDEIYVRVGVLAQLLPVDFRPDLANLALRIQPRETLPFQARQQREDRAKTISGPSGREAVMAIPLPYRLFTPPSVDLTLEGYLGNHSPKSVSRYDIRLGGDLLYSGLQLFAGSDDNGKLNSARILMERKAPSGGGLAGPLGLTRTNVGDTYTPNLSVGARSSGGRGIFATSEPLDQVSIFNSTDLRGELPLGYQVELYVNEVLSGSQSDPVSGRYVFEGVPLRYGVNVVRLVFYGPHGERHQDVRRISVGGGLLARGKTTFSLGLVQQSRNVIEVNPLPAELEGFLPGYGKLRLVGRLAHGISESLTIVGGFARLTPEVGIQRSIGTVGFLAGVNGISLDLTGAIDDSGGKALAIGGAGTVAGISLVARHSEYDRGFIDEVQPMGAIGSQPLRRYSALRADMSLSLGRRRLPLSFDLRRDQDVFGHYYLAGGLRTSAPIGRHMLSNSLGFQRDGGAGSTELSQMTGSSDLSGIIASSWQLRASATYDLQPGLALRSLAMSADHALSDRLALRLGGSHYFGDYPTTALQAGLTLETRTAVLSLNSSYVTGTKDFRIGLQVNVGALFDPVERRYRLAKPGVAAGSSMVLHAFEDSNGDGLPESGEAAIVGLRIASGGHPAITDARGMAIATGLGDGAEARVEVDRGSLDDPYLFIRDPLLHFVPRPGRVAVAKVPLTARGETTIKAVFDNGAGKRVGLSALKLVLLDAAGMPLTGGATQFDGTLFLEGLLPGTYHIAIDSGQAARLGLEIVGGDPVIIPASGGYVGEIPVSIRKKVAGNSS